MLDSRQNNQDAGPGGYQQPQQAPQAGGYQQPQQAPQTGGYQQPQQAPQGQPVRNNPVQASPQPTNAPQPAQPAAGFDNFDDDIPF